MNFKIDGKDIDGDSPTSIINALLDSDVDNYDKVFRKGKAKKMKTRSRCTVYYGCHEVLDTPADLSVLTSRPTASSLRPTQSDSEASTREPTRMKVYHILVKDRSSTAADYIILRTTSEHHKVTSKWIRTMLASMRT